MIPEHPPPDCKDLTWGGAGVRWRLNERGASLGWHGQGHLLLLVLGQRRLNRLRVDICTGDVQTQLCSRIKPHKAYTCATIASVYIDAIHSPFSHLTSTISFYFFKTGNLTWVSKVSKLHSRARGFLA